MDRAVRPGQTSRGRRRRWSNDQKWTVVQAWQTGIPFGRDRSEICGERRTNGPLDAQS